MFGKNRFVVIEGHRFSLELYNYLLCNFKEGFSHSSLSIEEAFRDLGDLDLVIETSKDKSAHDYFSLLSTIEKHSILELMHQMIVFKASRFGVFSEPLTGDQKQVERLYKEYFAYFEPYLPYYAVFDSKGEFDKVATFRQVDTLFLNLPQRKRAYDKAYNMKKDNLNAFDYAMSLDNITVGEVVKINDIVNESDEDKVLGFKRTNNAIIGASFVPANKQQVPLELQKLFADYKDGMGYDIKDPNEFGISASERYRRVCEILRREAEFHIRFERIHPFNDGNGRTGRIILVRNLLRQGVAPALITDVISGDYRNCINNYDVEGLAKILLMSSSCQLTNWLSMKKYGGRTRRFFNVNPENDELAKIDNEFSDGDSIIDRIFEKRF